MATNRIDINNANLVENAMAAKNPRVNRPEGLKLRENGRIENQCAVDADEKIVAKLNGTKPAKALAQRPPVVPVSVPVVPSFVVYCDDDEIAQDGLKKEVAQSDIKSHQTKTFEATLLTVDEEADSDESWSDSDRNAGYDDDSVFLSTGENDSSASHTVYQALDKTAAGPEDRISCHPDYAEDIYVYMREKELCLRPNPRYLQKQMDISYEMRLILINWLADVTVDFDLSLECFHLTVSIVDRALSTVSCPRLKLQLVGVTAMFIAAKFEEIYALNLKDLVYITDKTYTAAQILRMEKMLLNSLHFMISKPTSNWFGSRLARSVNCTEKVLHTMNYLLELALLDYEYLRYRPSVLASAAFYLANLFSGSKAWTFELEKNTGVSISEMAKPLRALLLSFKEAPRLEQQSIYLKYSGSEYGSVARLVPPASLPID